MVLKAKKFTDLTAGELYGIIKARVAVFVVEQNCPYQDLDGRDEGSLHVWLEESGELLAYLRILRGERDGTAVIGRVITVKRGQGLGTILMREGIRLAGERFGASKIIISAQLYAKGFYEKAGFSQCSEEYSEDGIPHIKMELFL